MQVLHKMIYSNWNIANALFIIIRFQFDLLVSDLEDTLLKLWKLILPSIHLLELLDFTNLTM